MRKTTSVKFKTIALSIVLPEALILIFATVLGAINYAGEYRDSRRLLLSDAEGIRDAITIELSQSFEMLRNLALNPLAPRVIRRMGGVPDGIDNDDFLGLDEAAELSGLMAGVSEGTNADLLFVGSEGSKGLLLSRDVQLADGFDVRGRDYFKAAFADPRAVVISEPRVSAEATAEPKIVITAARAVLEDGRARGIVALNYSFDPIIAIIRELERRYSLSIALYDTAGEYLLWTELAGGAYFYDPANVVGFDRLSQTMAMGERAGEYRRGIAELPEFFFEAAVDGEPSMIEAMRIPGTRWSLMVSSPISTIRRDVFSTILPPIVVFLVAFVVAQTLVYAMYARLIINPLVGIGAHLKRLADADADLTLRVPVQTNDEIGMVAVSFNAFTDKLRGLMLEVKRAIADTDTVKMSVIASTEETSSAIEQISANLDAIGKQIDVLDSSISSTVASIEEVTGNISAVDGRIISQASMVEESTAAITEMIASLVNVNAVAQNKRQATKALSVVAEDGKDRLTETAETFRTVSSQVLQIRDLASTINGIASQTNLLSMNAAIEAAHAGDSGKGFAVVADEIRKLADSAGSSAKTITQTIHGIIKAVEETDRNVDATTSAFERIAAEVADTVGAFSEIERSVYELSIGGQQILESTNQINEVTADVRAGSAEIKAGTESMLASSVRIREVSARVATGMAESITGSREIVRSMQEMVELNQRLGDIVGHLKERFGRFKTE